MWVHQGNLSTISPYFAWITVKSGARHADRPQAVSPIFSKVSVKEKEGGEQEEEEEEIEGGRQRGSPGGRTAAAARIFLFWLIQNGNDKKAQKERIELWSTEGGKKVWVSETLYSIFFLQF